MSTKDLLNKHYNHKLDQFNEKMIMFRGHVLCDIGECEQLIRLLNWSLAVESGNRSAKDLKDLLSLAIDIMRTEDTLVKLQF